MKQASPYPEAPSSLANVLGTVLREATRGCRLRQRESRGVILERRTPSHRPRPDRNQADDTKAEVNI